jgi:hypothetical protein
MPVATIVVVAGAALVVVSVAESWRAALFVAAVAAAIAATRVRFAAHVAALGLATLAVLTAAGVGVGSGKPVLDGSRLVRCPTSRVSRVDASERRRRASKHAARGSVRGGCHDRLSHARAFATSGPAIDWKRSPAQTTTEDLAL